MLRGRNKDSWAKRDFTGMQLSEYKVDPRRRSERVLVVEREGVQFSPYPSSTLGTVFVVQFITQDSYQRVTLC